MSTATGVNQKFLEIFKVGKWYEKDGQPQCIVTDFSLSLREGEFVSLIGHSGCGKSTVLSMVAGLATIDEGGVVLAGREIQGAGPDRGVVFQSPCLLPWLSALDNVLLAVDQVRPGESRKQRRDVAAHYLELVGLGDSLDQRPSAMSQGMCQRVGLARAFALDPKILLLDEPFGMLDSITRVELQEVLVDLMAKSHKTALMVTHDVDESLFLSDRIAMMTSGPSATLGAVLEVPFDRPRERHAVLEDSRYDGLRDEVIGFLEDQGHDHAPAKEEVVERVPLLNPAGQTAS